MVANLVRASGSAEKLLSSRISLLLRGFMSYSISATCRSFASFGGTAHQGHDFSDRIHPLELKPIPAFTISCALANLLSVVAMRLAILGKISPALYRLKSGRMVSISFGSSTFNE